nr:ribonuclease H-like domain-containing protein [Tanacetum cinerariifolium]
MKMKYWIVNTHHNLWKIIQNETKARTLLLQSLPEDHMADFYHLDDAREIWLAVKARFGGNEESKKMRKTMLKQAFSEFIMSLLPSWSQVSLTLKTRGGLEYLSFDDLYNKLRSLEIDVKGGSSYGSRSTTVAPTHSAFIGATRTNTQLVYSNQPSYSSSISYTPAPSGSIIEDILHSFVAENESTQQSAYEDFEQVDQLEMEELDIKWQIAMLSLRINKFQKKAGIKINFNNKDSARFDKRKARCYNCLQLRHFARECNVMKVDEKARYSAFKISETEEAEQVYGLMAGFKSDFVVHADNAAGGVHPAAAEFSMMGISPKWEVKFVESIARFDKWKESSKNLAKLLYSSMSTRTKLGIGFKEYIGSDEVCDLPTPSIFNPEPDNKEVKSLYERFVKAGNMHEVPPPITRTFMPTSYQSNLAETQATFGLKSNTFETNDFVSCDNSDKSSASETYDFASCVSSPKTNDSFSTVDVKLLPKSDIKDPSLTNGLPSCSFKENVKPLRNLCNKRGTADRIPCKNTFVCTKKCFVCGSKSHLIKDCNVHDTIDNFPSVVLKAASVPAGSRNSSASISAGRSIPAASKTNQHLFMLVHPHVNKDIGIIDSGCSRSMTGNREKLDDFVQVKGGTVTFGGGDGKITGKGTIRTSKLNFENVNYVEELQNFNLFFVSQICDKKNKVLFTVDECLVLMKEFQLPDESLVTEAVSTACYVLNRVSITNPYNKTPYELLSGKVPNIRHLKPFGCQVTILNISDHLRKFEGKANDGFLVGYAAHSTQADDSESECNEQVILVPSFPSNSFLGPMVPDVSAPMENNLDYAEELARLQRQEYEAHSVVAKHGFEFSDDTAALLHQATIDTHRNLVLAAGDPTGSIVSTGGVPASSVATSGVPAGSLPASIVSAGDVPAGSVPTSDVPAGSLSTSSVPTGGVHAGSIDSAKFGVPAASEFVPVVFSNDPAATSLLPPGHTLDSYEHTIRFPSSFDLGNHQPTAGIFSSSSYDDDFCADVTNLATKRVNTIHPQS